LINPNGQPDAQAIQCKEQLAYIVVKKKIIQGAVGVHSTILESQKSVLSERRRSQPCLIIK
jgi:hypothetical protein